jgi:hypothetical protein
MAHRTQITLTNEQYLLLRHRAERSGASISELIRRAVDRAYGASDAGGAEDPFLSSAGIWADMTDEDVAALEALRGPGLGARLARG